MANTYTQLYTHLVFAVHGRKNLINNKIKERIEKYISGIIKAKNQKLYIINAMPDHVHILLSIEPDCKISDLIRDIKSGSSNFINENNLFGYKFQWQAGYGAFSVSHSGMNKVINYIKEQIEHHKNITFEDEYKKILDAYKIKYDTKYLFMFNN